jgi:NADPH-dependent ferric siderophore reductase
MTATAHAQLDLPFDMLKAWLTAAPVYADRGRQEPDGSLHLTFGTGTLRALATEGRTALVLQSPDDASLQSLRDFVSETAAEAGVLPRWQERPPRGKPANLCLARVDHVEQISPAYRRIWLQGRDLLRLLQKGLHFRLLLGPSGSAWPSLDEQGLTQWPGGGAQAWHRPVYTVRSIQGAGRDTRVSFDVFLHQGGRVTDWSAHLQPGQEIALMGPSGGDIPASPAGPAPWFGLFGDETALPALARILAALPADATGLTVAQVPTAQDCQTLPHPPGLQLHWVFRDAPLSLAERLAQTALRPDNRFVFFAASASQAQMARDDLLQRGLGKKEFWAQAYWQDAPSR